MLTIERHIFGVRQTLLFAIGLIARGYNYSLHQLLMQTADFQEIIGPSYIGLERLQREAMCGPDDRLSS